MFHLTIVLGTRPEIIKLAPILRELQKQKIDRTLIHTNQHYSAELDQIFFEELELAAPTYNLQIGSGTPNEQLARMLTGIEKALQETPTSCVIVQGDTNSVLAGALVASKIPVPIAHIEAGLRSYDPAMPEEVNRIMTDHVSTFLFPPTQACADILLGEGIEPNKIKVVGNTIVDSVLQNKALCENISLSEFAIEKGKYYLLTLHRPSNVDSAQDLNQIFQALDEVSQKTGLPFFFPIHPRTENNIKKFKIEVPASVKLHAPVGYRQFLALQIGAKAIFTDSGGIQEEACILQIPCLTLRETTERPETVTVGANLLVLRESTAILKALEHFADHNDWENPFGQGDATTQILEHLKANL